MVVYININLHVWFVYNYNMLIYVYRSFFMQKDFGVCFILLRNWHVKNERKIEEGRVKVES